MKTARWKMLPVRQAAPDEGLALVMALFFFAVAMGFVVAGSTTMRAQSWKPNPIHPTRLPLATCLPNR